MVVASRKGFEPLTYGLGNRCSILLSYRDQTQLPCAPAQRFARPTSNVTALSTDRPEFIDFRRSAGKSQSAAQRFVSR